MSYLSDGLGKMASEGIEIRSAISLPSDNHRGDLLETDHLFKNRRNLIPLVLTIVGTAMLLVAAISQIWRL